MNRPCIFFALTALALQLTLGLPAAEPPPAPGAKAKPIFDGKTLEGWEGNAKLWRVEDGCLTGGSYDETVPRNEFLASTRDFTNFIIRFQIKLTGSNGFINSGFQICSQRAPPSVRVPAARSSNSGCGRKERSPRLTPSGRARWQ